MNAPIKVYWSRIKNRLNYMVVVMRLDRTYFVPRVALFKRILGLLFAPFGQCPQGNQSRYANWQAHPKQARITGEDVP